MNASQTPNWNDTQEKLKSFVFKYTHDIDVAADIVQDVFLKVHTKINPRKSKEEFCKT